MYGRLEETQVLGFIVVGMNAVQYEMSIFLQQINSKEIVLQLYVH